MPGLKSSMQIPPSTTRTSAYGAWTYLAGDASLQQQLAGGLGLETQECAFEKAVLRPPFRAITFAGLHEVRSARTLYGFGLGFGMTTHDAFGSSTGF